MRNLILASLLLAPVVCGQHGPNGYYRGITPVTTQRVTGLQPPYSVPLGDSNSWRILTESPNNKIIYGKAYIATDGGRAFDFETTESGWSDNYFWYQLPSPLNLTKCPNGCTLTVTVKISGPGPFVARVGDDPPPQFRPMLSSSKNGWSGNRWWANSEDPLVVTSYVTAPGIYTFTVPIQPQHWTGVYGNRGSDEAAWTADMASIDFVQITFGGKSFFGHGDSGNGTFEILNYAFF